MKEFDEILERLEHMEKVLFKALEAKDNYIMLLQERIQVLERDNADYRRLKNEKTS